MRTEPHPSEDVLANVDLAQLLDGIPPLELRILHLAISRAAELQAAGLSDEAETVLRELRDIVRKPRAAERRPALLC